jgi:hypothetical protein
MYCLCLNVYCHRVTTQLQLINISNAAIYLNISYHGTFLIFIKCGVDVDEGDNVCNNNNINNTVC